MSRPPRHLIQAGLAVLCLGTARDVAASEVVVEWTAPPECPDQADMVDLVERALGDTSNANLTATAKVTRSAGLFRAQVLITSSAGFGQRILENPRCELLAESVALVIALSTPQYAAPRRKPAHERSDGGLAAALSAHAAAVVGPLPRLAIGAGGTLAVEGFAALRLELSGTYYAHQTSRFDEMNIGARFRLIGFGARGCRLWTLGPFELAPCLGAQFYAITGKGFGGMVSHDGGSLLWGPTLGVLGRLRLLPQLAFILAADGVVPVSRRRFVFSDVGRLHRPSAFAFQLFAGPEVRF
jgi:hypothetical protein